MECGGGWREMKEGCVVQSHTLVLTTAHPDTTTTTHKVRCPAHFDVLQANSGECECTSSGDDG